MEELRYILKWIGFEDMFPEEQKQFLDALKRSGMSLRELSLFQQLIENSDALRTVFYEKDDQPYQHVLNTVDYNMENFDFSDYTELQIHDWVKERSQKNFDLSQVLFDSVLLKGADNKYKWFLNIHHLITDATSSTILYEFMCSF